MTTPALTHFRLELPGNGRAHLVFHRPGRTTKVMPNEGIVDLQAVADWLPDAAVVGLLGRSWSHRLINQREKIVCQWLRSASRNKRPPAA